MPAPISLDLRQRIADTLDDNTLSQNAIALRFKVSVSTVQRIQRTLRDKQPLAPLPHAGGQKPIIDDDDFPIIEAWLDDEPDLTQAQLAERFETEHERSVSRRTMGRVLKRMDQTRKKSR
ncbi:MAG: transposase [Bacteroidota bacterium]